MQIDVVKMDKPRQYTVRLVHPSYCIEPCPRCGYGESDGGYCPDCGWSLPHPFPKKTGARVASTRKA